VPETVIEPIVIVVFNTKICTKYKNIQSDNRKYLSGKCIMKIENGPEAGEEVV
jgi:hypothetical protein